MAIGAFSLAAVVLLCTASVVPAVSPELDGRDPIAARDVVELMHAGERRSWLVTYDFTRRLANGRVLNQLMSEGRNASLHVLLSASSMTIESRAHTYECSLVRSRSACVASTASAALPDSEVLRVAVAAGAYNVTRRPGATVAGEPARCFRVLATGHGGLPDIGVETDLCLAVDGVSLSQRVVHASGDVDERVARSVARRVTTRTLEELALTFDGKPPEARR